MSPHDQGVVAIFAVVGASVALSVFYLHICLHMRVRRLERKLRERGISIPYV